MTMYINRFSTCTCYRPNTEQGKKKQKKTRIVHQSINQYVILTSVHTKVILLLDNKKTTTTNVDRLADVESQNRWHAVPWESLPKKEETFFNEELCKWIRLHQVTLLLSLTVALNKADLCSKLVVKMTSFWDMAWTRQICVPSKL